MAHTSPFRFRSSLTSTLALAAFIAAAAASLSSCGPASTRSLADKAGVTFGLAVQAGDVLDPAVKKFIVSNFNLIVPENTLKWQHIRPTKTFWNWSDMDALVAFAAENKIAVKGHTFVWHQQNPPYVSGLKTREEAVALLTDQITTIMTRYKGKIREYDVANEVLNEDGTMRDTVWLRAIGPDYLDIAFKAARAADPGATLVLNDYNNEYAGTAKADAFYELAKSLKARGVPLDAVGLQLHLMADFPLNVGALKETVARFKELGMPVAFTEVDVRVKLPVTPEKEAAQRAIYEGLVDIAKNEDGAGAFVLWGYTDKKSWIPAAFAGYGSAHPFDAKGEAKPLYQGMKDILGKK